MTQRNKVDAQNEFIAKLIKLANPSTTDKMAELQANAVCGKCFYSPRSMRMTYKGYSYFASVHNKIKHYCIDLERNIEKAEHVLYVDRYLTGPYYINGSANLIVFSAEDAFELKMLNGNLDDFVELKRSGEDLYGE